MILIADAHVDATRDNVSDFFQMLQAIEKTDHDVIFLGDIFDLWVALPRYEKDIHRAFLTWCKEQKKGRTVGFVEGNHEYFVADEKKDYFTWCSGAANWRDEMDNLFCHGDQVNPHDKKYLRFRKSVKNEISKTIFRLLPFGPRIGELFKSHLKKTNLEFRQRLPVEAIVNFAEAQFDEGVNMIFVAHFHQDYHYRNRQAKGLYVLSGWFKTKQVTLYETASKEVRSLHWRELHGLKRMATGNSTG